MCRIHSKYKAIRVPKVDCDDCWRMYLAKHGNDKTVREYFKIFRGVVDKVK